MNHLMTLFDFERGPDDIAELFVLGLFLLFYFVLGIWVYMTTTHEDEIQKIDKHSKEYQDLLSGLSPYDRCFLKHAINKGCSMTELQEIKRRILIKRKLEGQ